MSFKPGDRVRSTAIVLGAECTIPAGQEGTMQSEVYLGRHLVTWNRSASQCPVTSGWFFDHDLELA